MAVVERLKRRPEFLRVAGARRKWVASQRVRPISPATLATLTKWYGPDRAQKARYVESFELCEYGRQPDENEIRRLFPMLGK